MMGTANSSSDLDKFLEKFAQESKQKDDGDDSPWTWHGRKRRRQISEDEEETADEVEEIVQDTSQVYENDHDDDKKEEEEEEDEKKENVQDQNSDFDSELQELTSNLKKICEIMGRSLTIEERQERMKEVRRQLF